MARQFSGRLIYDDALDDTALRVAIDGQPLYAPNGQPGHVAPLTLRLSDALALMETLRAAVAEWPRLRAALRKSTDRPALMARGAPRDAPEIVHVDGARSTVAAAQLQGFITWRRHLDLLSGAYVTEPLCNCAVCNGARVQVIDPVVSHAPAPARMLPARRKR